jgi:orotidine-5'-phosphate decarboxylase
MTQVIVALDVDTLRQEQELLEQLRGTITFYKVGLRLFTAHGRRAVELVGRYGGKVFLDLKFLDIPQTVAHAVEEAQKLGVEAVSLHLGGGENMLRAAAELPRRPKLWGVSILTSQQDSDLRVFHPKATVASVVKNLALMGRLCGADGIICSGHEVRPLRKVIGNSTLSFITPGIRPAGSLSQDQKRVMTPGEAARLAINYIVIGRPITGATDPLRAAQDIMAEMKAYAPHALEAS